MFATRELRLPADPAQLAVARRHVDRAAAEFGLDDARRHEFVFAVNEAVTNAIQHGSPAPHDTVVLSLDVESDTLVATVSDSGVALPEVADRGPMAESGRGLIFMDRFVDELELAQVPGGTVVRLCKRRPRGSGLRS